MKLDIVRVTEVGAIAAHSYIGSGDKNGADGAAIDAMRKVMDTDDWTGEIKIAEGVKDNAPMFNRGEVLGRNWREDDNTRYDIAADQIDGTTQVAKGGSESISVIAFAKKDMMWDGFIDGKEQFYMLKLSYGEKLKEAGLSVTDPLEETLNKAANALGKGLSDLSVCMLNRPRHQHWIDLMRNVGVSVKLIPDVDVTGAIREDVDLYFGIGGTTEAVLAAVALKCLGGEIQAIAAEADGKISGKVYKTNDLAAGPCYFVATGILNGSLLAGVKVESGKYVTNSVFMDSEFNTVRYLTTYHGN